MITPPEKNLALRGMRNLQEWIGGWSREKGWVKDGEKRDPLTLIALMMTELAEAVEAYRVGNPPCERAGMEHLTHAEEELADVIVRVFNMADEFGYDLAEAVILKMEFNEGRPHRHGGKAY